MTDFDSVEVNASWQFGTVEILGILAGFLDLVY